MSKKIFRHADPAGGMQQLGGKFRNGAVGHADRRAGDAHGTQGRAVPAVNGCGDTPNAQVMLLVIDGVASLARASQILLQSIPGDEGLGSELHHLGLLPNGAHLLFRQIGHDRQYPPAC